ncbi:uncharacterized protein LOC141528069 isoform X2 [Cotesia typhae]|uniref:uncharacterized protein LOC141528069 isoform X2 n=1 Tax=Cotesia typhae TaxID=2053667 RepID=UPI003D691BC9
MHDDLPDEGRVVKQKCNKNDPDFEKSTITDDDTTVDDNITILDDHIQTYFDNESICDDASIGSSCDDIYSICSCCNDDISSDEELNTEIDNEVLNEKLLETHKIEGDRIMFPAANLKVSDVLLMIQMFSISKNLTKTDENDLLKLVKVLAGPDFEAWDCSYYLRSKIFGVADDKVTLNFFCETCNVILTKRSLQNGSKKEKVQCEKCKKDHNISSQATNYFMSVDVRYQIQLILNQPQIQDSFFKHITADNQSSSISDVRDSNLYKKLKREYPHIFTLNYNTDGAPIFKSSKQSFWPQQLIINELPLEDRFKHIILGGIFLTDAEPKSEFMNLYNEELCNQVIDLMDNGVDIFNHSTKKTCNLKFALLCCCVDTPARVTC